MTTTNFKGLWIPFEILTDIKLSDKEKIIYSIILYLSKDNGYDTLVISLMQEENKALYKKSYHKQYEDYVCVDELGEIIKPDYITKHFKILLKTNHLRIIRFHDLRHSCASLLLARGISLKEIQEWLGHSNFNTTANIYAHLDSNAKQNSANALSRIFAQKNISTSEEVDTLEM